MTLTSEEYKVEGEGGAFVLFLVFPPFGADDAFLI